MIWLSRGISGTLSTVSSSDNHGSGASKKRGPPTLSAAFGVLILAHRKRLRWSQEELAGRAHIAPITVGRIERGEFRVTLEHAEAMADACQVPLWQLIKEASAGPSPEVMTRSTPSAP